MPFPTAPFNYSAPSASTIAGLPGATQTGGINPMALMKMLGGGGGGQQSEGDGMIRMEKNPYQPVAVDFSATNYADLIKKALMGG